MKKILNKFLALSLVLLLSLSAFACQNCGNDTPNSGNAPNVNEKPDDPKGTITPGSSITGLEFNTIHDIKVTPGTVDLVSNGNSEYKIVIPANTTLEEPEYAAKEIVTFIKQATEAEISIVTDEGLTYDASKKYISIGDTNLVEQAGITVNKSALSVSGYRIITKGNSVFLIGGGAKGTLYSAYCFLENEIDWEVYADNEIYFKTSNSLKLNNFDVTDVPDFEYRMATGGQNLWNNKTLRYRMRFEHEALDGIWMAPKNGYYWHNTLNWMPKDKYRNEHPLWYMDNGVDVCFNAHGNPAEKEAFYNEFMKNFIEVIEDNPTCQNITITQVDMNTWCSCNACLEEKNHYGTNAGTIVKFCNRVSDGLAKYFEENGIDRQVNICFFAYQQTTAAPVTKDANGKYVPIDDEVICRDNVYCYYAPIRAAFIYGFDDPKNSYFLETMEKWSVLAKHTYYWIYHVNFYDAFEPYNAISSIPATYKVLKHYGGNYLFDQGWGAQPAQTGWDYLRAYLTSKFSWNVNEDYQGLVRDFMDNYYKEAAEPMKKAFALYESWFDYLKKVKNVEGSYLSSTLFTKDNFTKGFVDGMLATFDEAYKAIEPLKTSNPAKYEMLYKRICIETIQYRYLNIEYHASSYTSSELLALKIAFKNDVKYLGITQCDESHSVDTLFKTWGIA